MAKADLIPLTESQREIMEVVWESGDVTVSEVWNALLKRKRDVARNTVQTMIVRLEEKGWLQHREQGRTFIYSAAQPRSKSLGAKVSQMVDRFFAGSTEEMVAALLDYRGLSKEEGQRIQAMIDAAETESKKNKESKASSKSKKRGRK